MSLPKGAVKIYDQLIEIRAKKGSKEESLFPNEYFKHSFKGKTKAAVYGLKNGALYICSQAGKPLHKKFEYSGRDYMKNPKQKYFGVGDTYVNSKDGTGIKILKISPKLRVKVWTHVGEQTITCSAIELKKLIKRWDLRYPNW